MNKIARLQDSINFWLLVIFVFAVGFFGYSSFLHKKEPASDPWFQNNVASDSSTVLVKFGADWCGPCRMLDKTLDKYRNNSSAVSVKFVNVDEQRELADYYNVRGIPKMILFREGKVVAEKTGALPYDQLVSWIESNR